MTRRSSRVWISCHRLPPRGGGLPAAAQPDGEDVSDVLFGKSRRAQRAHVGMAFPCLRRAVSSQPHPRHPRGDWKLLMNPDAVASSCTTSPRPDGVEQPRRETPGQGRGARADSARLAGDVAKGPLDPTAGKDDYPGRWRARPHRSRIAVPTAINRETTRLSPRPRSGVSSERRRLCTSPASWRRSDETPRQRGTLKQLRLIAFLWLLAALGAHAAPNRAATPNIVIVFCDDLGYADVGCFGAKGYATPNIDRWPARVFVSHASTWRNRCARRRARP